MPGTFDSTFDNTFDVTGGITLQSVTVSASSAPVAGGSIQFTAIATYSDTSQVDVTAIAIWSSSNLNIARVAATGIADFMFSAGSSFITASFGGFTGTYNVTIGNASFQPVDVVAQGLSRLPIQFKDKPLIVGLVQCILTPLIDLNQSIARTIVQRNANVATGQSLTNLGKLVGLPRLTTIDDDFRRYVRAQIAANKSLACYADILNIAVLILNDAGYAITLHQAGYATAQLSITGKALTDTVANILSTLELAAVAVGVRLVIVWSPSTPSTVFTLDTGPGLDSGHLASGVG